MTEAVGWFPIDKWSSERSEFSTEAHQMNEAGTIFPLTSGVAYAFLSRPGPLLSMVGSTAPEDLTASNLLAAAF